MCKCVDIFGGWWMKLLYMNSLSLVYIYIFFGMGYIFFYFFIFDMPCGHVAYLLWVCIFYFFLYSSYFFDDNFSREIVMV